MWHRQEYCIFASQHPAPRFNRSGVANQGGSGGDGRKAFLDFSSHPSMQALVLQTESIPALKEAKWQEKGDRSKPGHPKKDIMAVSRKKDLPLADVGYVMGDS